LASVATVSFEWRFAVAVKEEMTYADEHNL